MLPPLFVSLYYGTQSGDAKTFAYDVFHRLVSLTAAYSYLSPAIYSIQERDPEVIINPPVHFCTGSCPPDCSLACSHMTLLFLSTYEEGGPSASTKSFYQIVEDMATDFRVDRSHCSNFYYGLIGCCDSAYGPILFNLVARQMSLFLKDLGAIAVVSDLVLDKQLNRKQLLSNWLLHVEKLLMNYAQGTSLSHQKSTLPHEPLMDVEDLVSSLEKSTTVVSDDFIEIYTKKFDPENPDFSKFIRDPKISTNPMTTPEIRLSLKKQGYRIVGDHSGVKLCRWTKSMLRGRGGCYKHTFYGIESHRCMEATPSLACANKCIFCWRHNTNPVGTEWQWTLDPPDKIFQEAIEAHRALIHEQKGLPGAQSDRLQEAMMPKHCALSLVGEPIMYPHINDLIDLFHTSRISTFMVTNAQFPDRIQQLVPVTQLYLSLDASTKTSLKKVDRPLFSDYWERTLASLIALKFKCQRTVLRLTLVQTMNMNDLQDYATLIQLGNPDFIEVKGVTFTGTSSLTNPEEDVPVLTMKHSPFHQDVVQFCQDLVGLLSDYGLACEHEHSNCVLIAHDRFYRIPLDSDSDQKEWHTWIDYDKFQDCYQTFKKDQILFDAVEYSIPTPIWAVFGAVEGGFDPIETRHYRKKKDIPALVLN